MDKKNIFNWIDVYFFWLEYILHGLNIYIYMKYTFMIGVEYCKEMTPELWMLEILFLENEENIKKCPM